MNLTQLILNRYSVRNYFEKPVEEEKLLQVLDAARNAPSAVNYQPWHFVVIDSEESLEQMWSVYNRDWIKTAPIIIVACADHSQSWKRSSDGKDFADVDVSIAIDHITLKATELGLGTCWVCNFNADHCSEILNLPKDVEPIALIPIGYPNSDIPPKKRKPLEAIVHHNKFGTDFS